MNGTSDEQTLTIRPASAMLSGGVYFRSVSLSEDVVMAKAIPDGYHSVTPYIICRNAAAAIEFYKTALGAVELFRMAGPDGHIVHAEVKVGDSVVMLGEECEAWGAKSPLTLGGTSFGLCIYVENCDAAFAQAVAAGAKVERPVIDQFYGDRSGTVSDPFGHKWTIATHKEDLSPAELQTRMEAFMASMAAQQAA
jgi:PhnB protein